MKIISVIGTKDTGKTTLMVKIVEELVNRGFKVGTVKHVHGKFDVEGKDTWKHKESGAELVIGSGNETLFLLNQHLELDNILTMTECMKNLDYLVVEGFKHSHYAKISVSSLDDEYIIKSVDPFTISDSNLKSLADLIEERSYTRLPELNCGECGYDRCKDFAKAMVKGKITETACAMKKERIIKLKINGLSIPMNPFVQTFVRNTTIGMLYSLKGDELKNFEWKKIELSIENGAMGKTY